MFNLRLLSRRDLVAAVLIVACIRALVVYRGWGVEPREWGALCAQAAPPLACLPRDALLWLQQFYLWGAAALGLGLWAFFGAPFVVTAGAVLIGAASVINYNATWGMVGLALGVWAWIRRWPIAPRR